MSFSKHLSNLVLSQAFQPTTFKKGEKRSEVVGWELRRQGRYLELWSKWHLACLLALSGDLGSSARCASHSIFQLTANLGGSQWWLKYLGHCQSCWNRDPWFSSGLQASSHPTLIIVGIWGMNQQSENVSLSFSFHPSLSNQHIFLKDRSGCCLPNTPSFPAQLIPCVQVFQIKKIHSGGPPFLNHQ